MRATHSIQFYCRSSKSNKQGYSPVEMTLTINGERTIINLPRKEKPDDFQRLMSSRKSNDLKVFIDLMRSKVYEVQNEIIQDGRPITGHTIREYLRTGGTKSYTYKDLFSSFMEHLRSECTAHPSV